MTEELLRGMHSSLAVRWGTSSPYSIGRTWCERVGYAELPRVRCDVVAPENAIDALVPIVRQHVFGELAERGWDNHAIAFTPTVGVNTRTQLFIDQNESSPTHGRRKRGVTMTFSFEITDPELVAEAFFKTTYLRRFVSSLYRNIPQRGRLPELILEQVNTAEKLDLAGRLELLDRIENQLGRGHARDCVLQAKQLLRNGNRR